jgi:hypothetical protein
MGWTALPYPNLGVTNVLSLLVAFSLLAGCRHATSSKPSSSPAPIALGADALLPSPRLIIGRIIAVDPAQGFAFVDLVADPPAAALASDTELISRTLALHETGRLRVSRYIRGRTLGTKIVGGQPTPGDEVVWLAP